MDGRRRIPRALVAILVAGAALRLLFSNALRPAGYSVFLHLLHLVAPSLWLVVALQHLLGLATAALLYLVVGRSGAPRAWGLLPAALVALGADGVFLEHAAVSESLFMFLVAAALYCGVRSLDGDRVAWPAACGLSRFRPAPNARTATGRP